MLLNEPPKASVGLAASIRLKRIWKTLTLVMLLCYSLFAPSAAQAEDEALDLIAPSIDVSPIKEARPNKILILSAKVTDNKNVGKVTLYYRSNKTQDYKNVEMSKGGEGDVYFVTLPKRVVQKPNIEYYIQAADQAGNSVFYGYNYSPKKIKIFKGAKSQSSKLKLGSLNKTSTNSSQAKKSSSKKWLWIGLGALAAGAALSAGGGSDAPPTTGEETGDVTIVTPVP